MVRRNLLFCQINPILSMDEVLNEVTLTIFTFGVHTIRLLDSSEHKAPLMVMIPAHLVRFIWVHGVMPAETILVIPSPSADMNLLHHGGCGDHHVRARFLMVRELHAC
ncbi:hypothetical protein BV22DRAFT_336543 [Leucogyrophana mollusca]|uniref:Uncharacterized protein n=1 Tax=Leucogyrophana mollusca TaxID=85980 RepID=A0ACB8BNH2_9AGAM|nr:hypothetical protein BV22DRAFT_336543 [Leucogyrophana mollusca]